MGTRRVKSLKTILKKKNPNKYLYKSIDILKYGISTRNLNIYPPEMQELASYVASYILPNFSQLEVNKILRVES